MAGGGTPLGIAIARKQLEDEFPDADMSGKFNDAGGVPVEITGVIFFDRPHGQVGRGPNNLEIHPILSIKFKQHPVEFMAAAHSPIVHVAAATPVAGGGQGPGPGPQNPQNVTIQDATTGATATVTDGKALKVDASGSTVTCSASQPTGARGVLNPGQPSPDLGYPKALSVCWINSTNGGRIELSIDNSTWFTAIPAVNSGCASLPPARFVRLMTDNGGFYQASY